MKFVIVISIGISAVAWSSMSLAASTNLQPLPTPLTQNATIQQVRERTDELELRRTKLVERVNYDKSAMNVLSDDLTFIEDYQNSDRSSFKPRSIIEAEHPWAYASVVGGAAGSIGYGTDFQLVPRLFSRFADSALVQFLEKYPLLGKAVVRRSIWVAAVPIAIYKVWSNFKRHEELQSFKNMSTDEVEQDKLAEEAELQHYTNDWQTAHTQLLDLDNQLETLNGLIAVDQSPK